MLMPENKNPGDYSPGQLNWEAGKRYPKSGNFLPEMAVLIKASTRCSGSCVRICVRDEQDTATSAGFYPTVLLGNCGF